jgi:hypothetical protein
MGDDGNRIGHLVDAAFDQDTLEIQAYLLNSSFFDRLIGRMGRIQPDKVHACSRELMVVTTGRVKAVELAPEDTSLLSTTAPFTLKEEDRVAEREFETVPDGQPLSSTRR